VCACFSLSLSLSSSLTGPSRGCSSISHSRTVGPAGRMLLGAAARLPCAGETQGARWAAVGQTTSCSRAQERSGSGPAQLSTPNLVCTCAAACGPSGVQPLSRSARVDLQRSACAFVRGADGGGRARQGRGELRLRLTLSCRAGRAARRRVRRAREAHPPRHTLLCACSRRPRPRSKRRRRKTGRRRAARPSTQPNTRGKTKAPPRQGGRQHAHSTRTTKAGSSVHCRTLAPCRVRGREVSGAQRARHAGRRGGHRELLQGGIEAAQECKESDTMWASGRAEAEWSRRGEARGTLAG
jgi:hypothetical protein